MTRLTPSTDIHPNQTFYRTRMPCFATSKTDAILHRKFRTFIEQLGAHTSELRLPHAGIWALQRPRPSSPDSGPYSKRGFNSDSAIQRHVHSHRIDSLGPLINVPCFNVPHGRAAGHARPIVDLWSRKVRLQSPNPAAPRSSSPCLGARHVSVSLPVQGT